MPVEYTIPNLKQERLEGLAFDHGLEADVIFQHSMGKDGIDLNYKNPYPGPDSIPVATYNFQSGLLIVHDYNGIPQMAKSKLDAVLKEFGQPSPAWLR